MPRKNMSEFENSTETRERILDTATRLFAIRGFKAVSLKEIAKAIQIKVPSIYYYYEDKEALIEAVLARFGDAYKECYNRLAKQNEKAGTPEDVIKNLFDSNYFKKMGSIVQLGMSVVLKEQHNHEIAYQTTVKHIYEDGIRNVQAGFDKLIEKGIVPPSDTKTLATLFMFCVMCGNDLHIHEVAGTAVPVNSKEIYSGLKQLMIAALTQGIVMKPAHPA